MREHTVPTLALTHWGTGVIILGLKNQQGAYGICICVYINIYLNVSLVGKVT